MHSLVWGRHRHKVDDDDFNCFRGIAREAHAHTHARTHALTHTYTNTHTRTHTHTNTHKHTHTQTRTHTHTHTHKHTHTHTHTHGTYSRSSKLNLQSRLRTNKNLNTNRLWLGRETTLRTGGRTTWHSWMQLHRTPTTEDWGWVIRTDERSWSRFGWNPLSRPVKPTLTFCHRSARIWAVC